MLHVAIPDTLRAERDYVIHVVLSEFLGLKYTVSRHRRPATAITCPPHDGVIEVVDALPENIQRPLQTGCACPSMQLPSWCDVAADGSRVLPVLVGGRSIDQGITSVENTIHLPIDIFSSCFLLLTRMEERNAEIAVLDAHGRFPARSSFLYNAGLIERPLVDEYVSLLGQLISRLWPAIGIELGEYSVNITHDVDRPYSSRDHGISSVARRVIGDIVYRNDPALAYNRIRSLLTTTPDGLKRDPSNTFNWLMAVSERAGLTSTFYFMAAQRTTYDLGYDIGAPHIRTLLRNIADRGHQIGIHPSYYSADDPVLISREVAKLEQGLESAGITSWARASRQHYLRWSADSTWRHLANAGLRQDSTLGFADVCGFRCGTSRPFKVFDVTGRRPMPLVEKPLIVMDVTLRNGQYMGLDRESAFQKVVDLSAICRRVRSPLTILWHNDSVVTERDRAWYAELIKAIA